MSRIASRPEEDRIPVRFSFALLCLRLVLWLSRYADDEAGGRFGPAGDHVDILGRSSLNDLILRVAGGKGEQIEENVVSNILEYSAKVRIYDDE